MIVSEIGIRMVAAGTCIECKCTHHPRFTREKPICRTQQARDIAGVVQLSMVDTVMCASCR